MIKKEINLLVVGFAPHVIDVINICKTKNLKIHIIAGTRQKKSNQLEKDTYSKIKSMNFKNIEFISNLKKSKIYKNIITKKIEFIISIGSPFIFNKKLIKLYKNKLINCHGAPLPQYKGGGSLTWRFLNKDTRGCVLYHKVDENIDSGQIIYNHNFKFPKNKSISDWVKVQIREEKLAIKKILKLIFIKNLKILKLNKNTIPVYLPRIKSEIHGFIDFNWDGEYVSRFINAFSYPYDGAKTFVGNIKVKIFKSVFIKKKLFDQHPFLNGIIFEINKNYFFIFVNNGFIKVRSDSLQTSRKIQLGDRLHTPISIINNIYKTRVFFDAKGAKWKL